MGDSYGSATYGRLHGDDWLQASWTYAGLPVQITADVEYGGGKQGVYIPAGDRAAGATAPAGLKNYLHVQGSLSVPLDLSGGSHFRLLQPSFSITHYNSLMYDPGKARFIQGYQKYQASLWWSDNRRASTRCIVPRLGYAVRADVSGAFNDRFGTVYSLYARGYLPGLMRNHSITLRAGGMYQSEAELGFTQKPLFPRGAYNGWAAKYYGAAAFDYTFPLCYPNGGDQRADLLQTYLAEPVRGLQPRGLFRGGRFDPAAGRLVLRGRHRVRSERGGFGDSGDCQVHAGRTLERRILFRRRAVDEFLIPSGASVRNRRNETVPKRLTDAGNRFLDESQEKSIYLQLLTNDKKQNKIKTFTIHAE